MALKLIEDICSLDGYVSVIPTTAACTQQSILNFIHQNFTWSQCKCKYKCTHTKKERHTEISFMSFHFDGLHMFHNSHESFKFDVNRFNNVLWDSKTHYSISVWISLYNTNSSITKIKNQIIFIVLLFMQNENCNNFKFNGFFFVCCYFCCIHSNAAQVMIFFQSISQI